MTNYRIYVYLLIAFAFLGFSAQSYSQISQGGTPPSMLGKALNDDYQTIMLQAPDMEKIRQEDAIAAMDNPAVPRAGVSIIVNKGIYNSGTWTELADGGKIWRLSLECPGAVGLGLYYDDFQLPEGGELYLYNADQKQVIGAFTSANNHSSGLFATELIQGDKVTLEYYQPASVENIPKLNISELAYMYRFVKFEFAERDSRDPSWWCMINIACEEGDNWREEENGIAKILLKIGSLYGYCSGSLINNTNWDRQPYFLTAAHCGEGASTSDLNQWVFYFNYQSGSCSGSSGPQNQTMTGASLKAWDHTFAGNGSDFFLVLLNSQLPSTYNPFYNGWDRRDVPGDSGVNIHHPNGDIKKISTYDHMVSSSWPGGSSAQTHWRLWWIETANGTSVIQGGSSGSPVFNQDKRILGDLTGTYQGNSCESPRPAFYGKIYYSWDKCGNSAEFRLKDWLDPNNTGDTVCDGIPLEAIPPVANFGADETEVVSGEAVQFTDSTTNKPQSWTWIFEGANIDTSHIQNPQVMYIDTGYFDVTLQVSNPDGDDELIMEDYIHVRYEGEAPEADFEANATMIEPGNDIDFTDLTTNDPFWWEWYFEGGEPENSNDQDPQDIVYPEKGVFDVTLKAYAPGGMDSIYKEAYISVVWVGLDENKLAQNIKLYPNPSKGKVALEVANIEVENAEITVYNAIGEQIQHYNNLDNEGKCLIDLSKQAEGVYLISININDIEVVERISLVR